MALEISGLGLTRRFISYILMTNWAIKDGKTIVSLE
jgi:hypothetical protein